MENIKQEFKAPPLREIDYKMSSEIVLRIKNRRVNMTSRDLVAIIASAERELALRRCI